MEGGSGDAVDINGEEEVAQAAGGEREGAQAADVAYTVPVSTANAGLTPARYAYLQQCRGAAVHTALGFSLERKHSGH